MNNAIKNKDNLKWVEDAVVKDSITADIVKELEPKISTNTEELKNHLSVDVSSLHFFEFHQKIQDKLIK